MMNKTSKPDYYVEDRRLKEYPTEIGSQKFSPDDIQLFKLDKTSKLKTYYKSKFKELEEEYLKMVNDVKLNERIYSAKCQFEPIVGNTYHLYQKENGEEFLSLLSPNDWKKFEHIGSYKLLSDGRWEIILQ